MKKPKLPAIHSFSLRDNVTRIIDAEGDSLCVLPRSAKGDYMKHEIIKLLHTLAKEKAK